MNTDCINFFKQNQYNLLDVFELADGNSLSVIRKKMRVLSLKNVESSSSKVVFTKCLGTNQMLDFQIDHEDDGIKKLAVDMFISDAEIANGLLTYVVNYYQGKFGPPQLHLADIVWGFDSGKKISIKKLNAKLDKGLQIECSLI